MTTLTAQAKQHLINLDYASALDCYLQLCKIIDKRCFKFNLELCLKEIDRNPATRPTNRLTEIQQQIQTTKLIGDVDRSLIYLKKLLTEARTNTSKSAPAILAKEQSSDLFALDLITHASATNSSPIANRENGKLLYILHHSLPYISNGYATRAHGMAVGMKNAGLNVVCATRPGFPIDIVKDEVSFCPSNEIDGVLYRHTAWPKRSGTDRSKNYFADATKALIAVIKEEAPSAILVASNYVNAIPAILAAKATGTPIAYEVRGFWEITEASKSPAFADSYEFKLKKRLESEATKSVPKIFTLGSAMKEELAQRGANKSTISIIPNGCNGNQFMPATKNEALLAKLRIEPSTPVIGYIGSFVQYEGLDDLTEACAELAKMGIKYKLLLIGSGSGDVYDKIQQIIRTNNLQDYVIMPGRVPHHDVHSWYSIIDIAPFPRKSQAVTELVTPLKPMEAMSMGKAVVVSSVGGMAEMVANKQTGLIFEKDNVSDLRDKLEVLIRSESIRKHLGANARQWILAERTWDRVCNQVVEWAISQEKALSPAH